MYTAVVSDRKSSKTLRPFANLPIRKQIASGAPKGVSQRTRATARMSHLNSPLHTHGAGRHYGPGGHKRQVGNESLPVPPNGVQIDSSAWTPPGQKQLRKGGNTATGSRGQSPCTYSVLCTPKHRGGEAAAPQNKEGERACRGGAFARARPADTALPPAGAWPHVRRVNERLAGCRGWHELVALVAPGT